MRGRKAARVFQNGLAALLLLAPVPLAAKAPGGSGAPSILSAFVEICLGAVAEREPVADRIARRFAAARPEPLPPTPPGIRATGAWRLAGDVPLRLHLAEPGGQCILLGEAASAPAFLSEVEALLAEVAARVPGFVRLGPSERGEPGPGRVLLRARLLEAVPAGHPPRVIRVLASAGGGGPAVISAETEEAEPLRR